MIWNHLISAIENYLDNHPGSPPTFWKTLSGSRSKSSLFIFLWILQLIAPQSLMYQKVSLGWLWKMLEHDFWMNNFPVKLWIAQKARHGVGNSGTVWHSVCVLNINPVSSEISLSSIFYRHGCTENGTLVNATTPAKLTSIFSASKSSFCSVHLKWQ